MEILIYPSKTMPRIVALWQENPKTAPNVFKAPLLPCRAKGKSLPVSLARGQEDRRL